MIIGPIRVTAGFSILEGRGITCLISAVSLFRRVSSHEAIVERPLGEVFHAFERAGGIIGSVTKAIPEMGTMAVRTPATVVPMQIASSFLLSFEAVTEERTKVVFQTESGDGFKGLGLPGGAMDRLVACADLALTGRPLPRKSTGMLLLTAGVVFVAVSLLVLFGGNSR